MGVHQWLRCHDPWGFRLKRVTFSAEKAGSKDASGMISVPAVAAVDGQASKIGASLENMGNPVICWLARAVPYSFSPSIARSRGIYRLTKLRLVSLTPPPRGSGLFPSNPILGSDSRRQSSPQCLGK